MDWFVIFSGVATLFLSLFLGIFVLYWGYHLFSRFTRNMDEEKELLQNNVSVAILAGSFIFSLGYVLKSSLKPLVQSVFRIMFYGEQGWLWVFTSLLSLLLQFAVTLALSILTLWIGLKTFTRLNRNIREFEEIKKNNIAVAVFTGVILITLSLFVREGLDELLQVLILQPEIQNNGITPFG